MTPSETPGPVATALFRAGWPGLSDRLVAGLCHDLNGRASALAGLSLLLVGDGGEDDDAELIASEVEKLEELARLLRLLAGDADGAPEPLAPADLLPLLVALQSRERGMENVSVDTAVDSGAPPVLVSWSGFGRVVLLALSATAGAAGAGSRLRVSLAANEAGGLRVVVEAEGAPAGATPAPALDGLGEVVELLGGRLAVGEAGAALDFPSLAQARGRT